MEDLQTGRSLRNMTANTNNTKDGRLIHCEWYNSIRHDSIGNVKSIFSLILDVTKRKEAEMAVQAAQENLEERIEARTHELEEMVKARENTLAALSFSEERFRLALEHAPIGIALLDLDGKWLKVNKALCDLVGYPEMVLLNKTFQDITHPQDL